MSAIHTVRPVPSHSSKLDSALRWLLIVSCIGVAGYALVFYLGMPPKTGHFAERLRLLQIHATCGAVALLTGPWQFWTQLRDRRRKLHRWLGRIYFFAVLISSIAGLPLAFYSEEGWPTHAGFGLLSIFWFGTAYMAYIEARKGNFVAHRRWTVRNFSLTFAAVMLRQELPLMLFAAHMSFHVSYIIVSWLCWVPNLLFAEWWLRRGTPGQSSLSSPQ